MINVMLIHKYFRAKPPSTVYRDMQRQQQWIADREANMASDIQESAFMEGESMKADGSTNKQNYMDSGINMSPPDCLSTPILQPNHNVIIDSTFHETTDFGHTDHNVPSKITVFSSSSQTDQLISSTSVQTGVNKPHVTTVGLQHPSTKRKYAQTYKTSTQCAEIQTILLEYKDSSCQCKPIVKPVSTSTELPIGSSKGSITDPPVNRHIQTNYVKMLTKKTGKTCKDKSTEPMMTMHYDTFSSQTDDYDYMDEEYEFADYDYDAEKSEIEKRQDEISKSIAELSGDLNKAQMGLAMIVNEGHIT